MSTSQKDLCAQISSKKLSFLLMLLGKKMAASNQLHFSTLFGHGLDSSLLREQLTDDFSRHASVAVASGLAC